MTLVVPRIVSDISYVTRISHDSYFAWQAQYLVMLNCHFAWQAQYLVISAYCFKSAFSTFKSAFFFLETLYYRSIFFSLPARVLSPLMEDRPKKCKVKQKLQYQERF